MQLYILRERQQKGMCLSALHPERLEFSTEGEFCAQRVRSPGFPRETGREEGGREGGRSGHYTRIPSL